MRSAVAFLVLVSLFAVGCAPSESSTASTPTDASKPVAEMAKCDFCGTEVAKAELASHDGKMACKKCIEAHNH